MSMAISIPGMNDMSNATDASREMQHFLLLTHIQQIEAIRRLHALGWSDYGIASATRLSVEQVRRLLGEAKANA